MGASKLPSSIQAFQLLNHPFDDTEAALPESGIAGVEAERG
jgi:hypothetical protein